MDNLKSRLANLTPAERQKLLQKINVLAANKKNDERSLQLINDKIAIVGMAFRFPGEVEDIESFWRVLADGQDAIIPVPADRPRHEKLKWQAGYISHIDKFDTSFFNISPREAELMDPQQRVLLQTIWHTFEDAGYDPNQFAGSLTGLYVGLATQDYQELLLEQGIHEAYGATGTSPAVMANRISYWFDLRGPSETIDTACSSSLVALHHAVTAIQMKQCEQALVAGVNLLISPHLFTSFEKAGMLSPDQRCKTFDNKANGYVRGEGVAALLLKPLAKAQQAGDKIYGVILGAAVNHGGKANSLTAPNPQAQTALLCSAYRNAGILPASISYIEAHGTGTALGDPIEVEALKAAFAELSDSQQSTAYCGLGSVKTNVGHLEAVAGLAGLVKVLVAMQQQKIPGIVNYQSLNSYIDLQNSPFYIAAKSHEWARLKDERGNEIPRRAGISSFGFGGTNAHVIVEEPPAQKMINYANKSHYLVTLSAKQETILKAQLQNLMHWLDNHSTEHLENISFTLNTTRHHFAWRCAFVVATKEELQAKLKQIILENQEGHLIKLANEKLNSPVNNLFEKLQAPISPNDYKEILKSMANAYLQGHNLNWTLLHQGESCCKLSVPNYPFMLESHWIDNAIKASLLNSALPAQLHPLVEENASTLEVQRFKTLLKPSSFYVQDHVIKGEKILPGVCYLEMARKAGELSRENNQVVKLEQVVWQAPIKLQESQTVFITVELAANNIIYRIRDATNNSEYGQGLLVYGEVEKLPPINLAELLGLPLLLTQEQFYVACADVGFAYGQSMRTVQWLKSDGAKAFGYVRLNDGQRQAPDREQYGLHPSLLDGALQLVMGLQLSQTGNIALLVPFALNQAIIYGDLPDSIYVIVERCISADTSTAHYNLQITDEAGEIKLILQDLSARLFKQESAGPEVAKLAFYRPVWESTSPQPQTSYAITGILAIGLSSQQQIGLQNRLGCSVVAASSLSDSLAHSLGTHISHVIYKVKNQLLEQSFVQDLFKWTQALLHAKCQAIHFLYITEESTELPLSGLVKGFAKAVHLEQPNYRYQVVYLSSNINETTWIETITNELTSSSDQVIRYEADKRYKQVFQPLINLNSTPLLWREGGIYLITGGLGGLGLIFAYYLAENYKAKLILTGRSKKPAAKIKILEKLGGEVLYISADISQQKKVGQLIQQIKQKYGSINGIIHSAGILKDSLLLNKTDKEFNEVLAAKVAGTVYLNEATSAEPLDYFITFSSIASIIGNAGQADYVTANAFLDDFSVWRDQQVQQDKAFGKTININWPLWAEGGMQVDATARQYLADNFGMQPLPTEIGLHAFEQAIKNNENQTIVFYGQTSIFSRLLNRTISIPEKSAPLNLLPTQQSSELTSKIQNYLKNLLEVALKLPANKIELDTRFDQYGIDSLLVMELTQALEKEVGILPKTLFFEYQTIAELASYLVAEHAKKFAEKWQLSTTRSEPKAVPLVQRFISKKSSSIDEEDIAIIGLAGYYPQAKNLKEFWHNLAEGKDCIVEIPKERWDWREMYNPSKDKPGKSYSKWGSFLEDYDKFDPLFFNISPREAELMDPQERLFLQVAWHTLEDAGYTPERLGQGYDATSVGVFTGVMYGTYQQYSSEEAGFAPSSFAFIANRVSYYLNLHGPSLAVDTMCSSSLTAIHLACKSIKQKECELALAGGVNVTTHPNKYLFLSQGKYLSSEGKCKSFGIEGDGYVPGEGVGAVLLKSLTRALADGDYIYGVIKSSAINHGGKTNGVSVPNPIAQGNLITQALTRAKIDPMSISYMEAHGTGTSLGDPIEVRGLNKAFAELAPASCPIGSIKSNIGHLESAAGIVALTKVLLQLKYKKLVPSIHSKQLNPHIDFANSPFYVQQDLSEWHAKPGYLRRAGISSFGAGGSNAHLIIEEGPSYALPAQQTKPYYLITLSARHPDSLEQQVKNLRDFCERHIDLPLAAIAYTLNINRCHFNYRYATAVSSVEELITYLHQPIKKVEITEASEPLFKELSAMLIRDLPVNLDKPIVYKEKLLALADLYMKGYQINWLSLHQSEARQHIHLPLYPFLPERYWLSSVTNTVSSNLSGSKLHPLIDSNESSLQECLFKKVFYPHDIYLADHKIFNQMILPGTAYLEMARVAGSLAGGRPVFTMRKIRWLKPIICIDQPVTVWIKLVPEENDQQANFQIYTQNGNNIVIHTEGHLDYQLPNNLPERVNIAMLQAQCTAIGDKAAIYSYLHAKGFNYGASFQATNTLYGNEKEGLASLSLPAICQHDFAAFSLHPGLLDAGLRAGLAINHNIMQANELSVPFYLEELVIYKSIPATAYAYAGYTKQIQSKELSSFDITLTDSHGETCVSIQGFNARPFKNKIKTAYTYRPTWQKQALNEVSIPEQLVLPPLVVIGENDEGLTDFINHLNWPQKILKFDANKNLSQQFKTYLQANQQNEQTLLHILSAKKEGDEAEDLAMWLEIFQTWQNEAPKVALHYVAIYTTDSATDQPHHAALASLNRAVKLLAPNFTMKVIGMNLSSLPLTLTQELIARKDNAIYYEGNERFVRTLIATELPDKDVSLLPLRQNGIYLITGGLGGLGKIFARYLSRHYHATLILTGRSPLNPENQTFLNELRALGGTAHYFSVDMGADQTTIQQFIVNLQKQFGKLQGILHVAGIVDNIPLVNITKTEFLQACRAKWQGTRYLDEATQDQQLDFFVTFSSIASELGDYGIGSYAFSNRYMDCYMQRRTELVKKDQRHGISLSIQWPYWADGGMQLPAEEAKLYFEYAGMQLLTQETGLELFRQSLLANESTLLVAIGSQEKIERVLGIQSVPAISQDLTTKEPISVALPVDANSLFSALHTYLINLLARVNKIPPERINIKLPLEEYGVDSVVLISLNQQLSQDFPGISNTIFFEYRTLEKLADYLLKEHIEQVKSLLPGTAPVKLQSTLPVQHVLPKATAILPVNKNDVAIIGISGRYPEADTLEEFWNILQAGRNCIKSVPTERWQHNGQNYYGGYINDVDKFDAAFFNVLPEEANIMTPELRLLLETTWHALENAGYTRKQLELYQDIQHKGIGVFVANMYQQYPFVAQQLENAALLSVYTPALLANRISHFFNFQGPSITLDAACAGSLTAIHMACENIRHGECMMAIAGGVNLHLHPASYEVLTQTGLMSKGAESRGLGQGNGYIPGEGLGIVLLKSLQLAIENGDNILGIIKNTVISHGGGTHTLTLPNPTVQANAIKHMLQQADVHPNTISYVECAANGARVGDVLEIKALTKAFKEFTTAKQFCPIGTVKSNIGHLEAASGISQLTKVICQLKAGKLVPSINAEPLNPDIDLSNSPFYLQNELTTWQRPVVEEKDNKIEYPRRALISSFGAGGSNAHMLVEEYMLPLSAVATVTPIGNPQQLLFLFSAKSISSLKKQVVNIHQYLEKNIDVILSDIAYTLQMTREAMRYRLAILASSYTELLSKLVNYINDSFNERDGYLDSTDNSTFEVIAIDLLIQEKDISRLAKAWVKGTDIPWENLYAFPKPKRLPLPGYVFEKKRYWLESIISEPVFQTNLALLQTQDKVIELLANILDEPAESIQPNKKFTDYGIDSLRGMRLINRINDFYQLELEPITLMDYSTVTALADKIDQELQGKNETAPEFIIKTVIPYIDYNFTDVLTNEAVEQSEKMLTALIIKGLGIRKENLKLIIERHANLPQAESIINEITAAPNVLASYLQESKCYYPLSFSQQMMCVQSELYKNSAYQLVVPFNISQEITLVLLEKALQQLVQRHCILRTTFPKIQNRWMQLVHADINIKIEDFHYTAEEITEKVGDLLLEEKKYQFDLANGPLFRLKLIHKNTGQSIIILNIHHAICDGIAVSLFMDELIALYEICSQSNEEQIALPQLSAQYTHFVLEQVGQDPTILKKEIGWWTEKLNDAPLQTELPYDYNHEALEAKRGEIAYVNILSEEKQLFDNFIVQEKISLTVLVFTSLFILLNEWTQQKDLIVGTVLNQRNRLEYENLIGDFTNIIPMRFQLPEDATGKQILHAVQQTLLEVSTHQKTPFNQLMREISHKRNKSNLSFYNVFLDSLNYTAFRTKNSSINIDLDLFPYFAKLNKEASALMDLFFFLIEKADSFAIICTYRADLFKNTTIKGKLDRLIAIMHGLIMNPNAPLKTYCEQRNVISKQKVQLLSQKTTNVFCLPGADGSYNVFKRLISASKYYKPYAVKYKDIANNDMSFIHSVEAIATDLIEVTHNFKTPEPFALLGLSFGGLVALEICKQLQSANLQLPQKIILLDTPLSVKLAQPEVEFNSFIDFIGEENKNITPIFIAVNWAIKAFGHKDVILFTKDKFVALLKDMNSIEQEEWAYQWLKNNTDMLLPSFAEFSQWVKHFSANIFAILNYKLEPLLESNLTVKYVAAEKKTNPLHLLFPDFSKNKNKKDVDNKKILEQLFPLGSVNYYTISGTDHYSLFSGENVIQIAELLSKILTPAVKKEVVV